MIRLEQSPILPRMGRLIRIGSSNSPITLTRDEPDTQGQADSGRDAAGHHGKHGAPILVGFSRIYIRQTQNNGGVWDDTATWQDSGIWSDDSSLGQGLWGDATQWDDTLFWDDSRTWNDG